MPVYPTGFSGDAVVPCSHCNANDCGPEPGICHRNPFRSNTVHDPACGHCVNVANKTQGKFITGLLAGAVSAVSGNALQTPCSYCGGKGYVKV